MAEAARPGPLHAGPDPMRRRSRRKRSRLRVALGKIIVPLAVLFARALWRSCRPAAVLNPERAATLAERPAIVCFWHEHIILSGACLARVPEARGKYCTLVSPSVDGDLVTAFIERFGTLVVRGSATRSSVGSMRKLYRAMEREGASLVLPPDGPQGPARASKAGVILLSQLSGAPILPIGFAARRSYGLWTWDSMRLPLPFTRVAVAFGEPWIPAAGDGAVEAEMARLDEALEGLARAAAGEVGRRATRVD